jgi:hypothetical protein
MSESSANSNPEIEGFEVLTAVTMENAVFWDV